MPCRTVTSQSRPQGRCPQPSLRDQATTLPAAWSALRPTPPGPAPRRQVRPGPKPGPWGGSPPTIALSRCKMAAGGARESAPSLLASGFWGPAALRTRSQAGNPRFSLPPRVESEPPRLGLGRAGGRGRAWGRRPARPRPQAGPRVLRISVKLTRVGAGAGAGTGAEWFKKIFYPEYFLRQLLGFEG